jgi:hypothetical protein
MKKKPIIFIGCSTEYLEVAYNLQAELEYVAEPTVWTQDIFNLSSYTFIDLEETLQKTDFAIFIFGPDDLAIIRGKQHHIVRDNIIAEFFYAAGILNRNRVFAIVPRSLPDDFHLPTDLLGLTPGSYDANRSDGNLRAALGPVSLQIKKQIIREVEKMNQDNLSGQFILHKEGITIIIKAEKKTEDIARFLITFDLPDRERENTILMGVKINSHPCSAETLKNFKDPKTGKVCYAEQVNFVESIKMGFPRTITILPPDNKPITFINLYQEYQEGLFRPITTLNIT